MNIYLCFVQIRISFKDFKTLKLNLSAQQLVPTEDSQFCVHVREWTWRGGVYIFYTQRTNAQLHIFFLKQKNVVALTLKMV
jgi:hypothetical protein